MDSLFNDCLSIKVIDVSNFDTSKVTNMSNMFRAGNGFSAIDRELLEIIGLENFDTNKVTNMSGMFISITKAITLDVTNFDTSNITDMAHMIR